MHGVSGVTVLTRHCIEPMCFASQFKRIDEIESVPAGSMLDVLGVLHSIGDFTTITLKNGTEQSKRSIVLRDNSNRSIELTMWAEFANEPGDQLAQVRLVQHTFAETAAVSLTTCVAVCIQYCKPKCCLMMVGVWLSHVFAAA